MQQLKFKFIFVLLAFMHNIYCQNCNFTINVPQDVTICEEDNINLTGNIAGTYAGFEWKGTNGYSQSANLTPTVTVSQTTTYTLNVFSNPTTNLIVNGDFSNGNTGFLTDYNYVANIPFFQTEMYPEGTYTVINNPNLVHNGFNACNDHTGGGGRMMVVNGAAAYQQVWCQTIAVTPNTPYIFQAFATSVNSSSPAILQFSIDGDLLGTPFGLSGTTCNWEEFNTIWDSGGNTSVEICINNQNTALGGNDFALDDLFFGALCRDEKSFTVTLSTFELVPPTQAVVNCSNPLTTLGALPLPDDVDYQYFWQTDNGSIQSPADNQSIFVNSGGEYTVIVTNQQGCTLSQTYLITDDFTTPDVTITGDRTLDCIQKQTQLSASSTDDALEYYWVLPNQTEVTGPNLTAVYSGNYFLNSIGSNGCVTVDTVSIILENTLIQYTAQSRDTLSCSVLEAQIFLDLITEIDSISWIGPDIIYQNKTRDTITVGSAGIYVFELFLGTDCSIKDSIFIRSQPTNIFYTIPEADTLDCNKPSTMISISNPVGINRTNWIYQGKTIGTSDSVMVSSAGLYIVEAFDNYGCKKTDSIYVEENFLLPFFTVDIDSIDCIKNYGQFTTNFSDEGVFFWEGQDTTSYDMNPKFEKQGIYNLTVTGKNGCKQSQVYYLPSSISFPAIQAVIEPINCSNMTGKISINTSIPCEIIWADQNGNSGSGSVISTTNVNTYTVLATSSNGCKSESIIGMTIDTIHPVLMPISPEILTCVTTSVVPSVNASDYTYINWTGPSFLNNTQLEPSFSKPGSYYLTLSNSNGCERSAVFEVSENTAKPVFSAYASELSCKSPETKIKLTGDPNLYYTLVSNNQAIQDGFIISAPGIYAIQASNSFGCDSTIILEVKGNFKEPEIQLETILLNCFHPSVWASNLKIDTSLEYIWNSPDRVIISDSILIDKKEAIELVAVNIYGCESKLFLDIITDFSPLEVTIDGDIEIGCKEEFTTVVAKTLPTGIPVTWEKDSVVFSTQASVNISEPGTYTLDVINPANGCKDVMSIMITQQPNPDSIFYTVMQPLCFGDQGGLVWSSVEGGTSPYVMKVGNEILKPGINYKLDSGSYILSVTDANGCTVQSEFTLEQTYDFNVNAGKDTTILRNTSHQLQAFSDLDWTDVSSISWTPASSLSCNDCREPIASPAEDTEYYITLSDKNGCVRSDSIWVRLKLVKGYDAPNIIIPGSISGNSHFTIYPVLGSIESILSLRIFDRWGSMVFATNDIPAGQSLLGWDGTRAGKNLQPDVYVWVAEIMYLDKTKEIAKGDVTIIK